MFGGPEMRGTARSECPGKLIGRKPPLSVSAYFVLYWLVLILSQAQGLLLEVPVHVSAPCHGETLHLQGMTCAGGSPATH